MSDFQIFSNKDLLTSSQNCKPTRCGVICNLSLFCVCTFSTISEMLFKLSSSDLINVANLMLKSNQGCKIFC